MKTLSTIMLLVLALASAGAFAVSEDWFCTTQSSEKRGDVWAVCGIATAKDEQTAREQALDAAYREFRQLCIHSDDCHYRSGNVTPKRLQCEKDQAGYLCRQLVEIEVVASTEAYNSGEPVTQQTIVDGIPLWLKCFGHNDGIRPFWRQIGRWIGTYKDTVCDKEGA